MQQRLRHSTSAFGSGLRPRSISTSSRTHPHLEVGAYLIKWRDLLVENVILILPECITSPYVLLAGS